LLWFAFKIYIFDILIQHNVSTICIRFSCDLLSKFISLIFWYNRVRYRIKRRRVVICFQNLYLWYSDTTNVLKIISLMLLWFAFKIYIFDILIQPITIKPYRNTGCDLLSKFISLIFWYNMCFRRKILSKVVICFQNLYLWYSDTTNNF